MTVSDTAQTLRPDNLAEARDAMVDTAGALLFRAAGTKLDWGASPRAVDAVIDTSRMSRLLVHNPADATAAVQAGMPLARLQESLAETGQWLAIDPPAVDEGATVGGILAAGDAGPRRLAFGTIRDLVIGVTVVLADGAIGRSGGFVIKNVAGYDLAKLMCGSLGTLGLIAEVVVRLHPLPRYGRTVRAPATAAAAARVSTDLSASPLEPVAVDWAEDALWVRFQGHAQAVDAQVREVMHCLQSLLDVEVLDGDDDTAAWARLTAGLAGAEGETVVRAASLATQLGEVADALAAAADRAGVEARLSSHSVLGVHTARLSGGDAAAHAACVEAWRDRLAPLGGHAVVRRRIAGLEEFLDVWGPPPSAIDLMRRVKHEFDPGGRCAPGRFVGGI